jgi:hypothetical protein
VKFLLAAVVLFVVSQVPSCEPAEKIVGFVDDKYMIGNQPYILIGPTEYRVDLQFYLQVRIGDLVKFEDGRWVIVKKASGMGPLPRRSALMVARPPTSG